MVNKQGYKKGKIKNKGELMEMSELDMYIDNDYHIYQVKQQLAKNYKKKFNKKGFDFEKAEKGIRNLVVDKGARAYDKEFGNTGNSIFNKNVRDATAKAQIRKLMRGIKEGEFD
jgi:hypothetical protein